MKKASRFLALLIPPLSLTGCLEQVSHRNCPGFEDRSVVSDWAPYQTGTDVNFKDQNGASLTLQFESIQNSEPYKESNWGKDSSVACILTSTYTLTVKDAPHLVTLDYEHNEFSDREFEYESLTVRIRLKETREGDDSVNSGFIFFLRKMELNNIYSEFDGIESSFEASKNIGGIDYQDVLDEKKLPGDRRPFNLAEDKLFRITRVVFSRYTGITALEYEDGSLYTLVH